MLRALPREERIVLRVETSEFPGRETISTWRLRCSRKTFIGNTGGNFNINKRMGEVLVPEDVSDRAI